MMPRPLTESEIISLVQYRSTVPDAVPRDVGEVGRRLLAHAQLHPEEITAVIAVWPDGIWCPLAHDPDWSEPQDSQLLRAYGGAHQINQRLPLAEVLS